MFAHSTIGATPVHTTYDMARGASPVIVSGTGTAYGMDRVHIWQPYLQPRIGLILEAGGRSMGVEKVDLRTPRQHLENIRAVLKPTVSDLAATFEVSRQAIYKWLSEESKPEVEKLARVQALSQIADKFKTARVIRPGALLQMNAIDDRSLLDIVKSGDDWRATVDVLIDESRAMERAYARSGLAESKAKATSDWQTTQSIPASREDC